MKETNSYNLACVLKCSLLLLLVLASCTIEKRLHRPGYHIEWHKRNQNAATTTSKVNDFTEQSNAVPELIKTDSTYLQLPVEEEAGSIENVTKTSASLQLNRFFLKRSDESEISKKVSKYKSRALAKQARRSSGPGLGLVTIFLIAGLVYVMYTIFHILFITAENAFLAAFPYMLLALLIVAIIVTIFITEDWG